MSNEPVNPNTDEPPEEAPRPSVGQRVRGLGKATLLFAVVVGGTAGYIWVPVFNDGLDWLVGMLLLALTWLWLNGYALPVLVGLLVYLTDVVFGVRFRTWLYNMGRVKQEAKVRNLGYGLVHDRPLINEFIVAAAVGVAYSFVKLTWFNGSEDNETSAMAILLDWRAHLEFVEVTLGVLLGIWLAPWVGRFLRQFQALISLHHRVHYEEWPILGTILQGIGAVYLRLYRWGHLENILSEDEQVANQKAVGIDRAMIYPLAFLYNAVRGVLRFLFAPGHAIFGVGLRWFVWAFILVVLPWMRELWAPVSVSVVNYSLYLPIMLAALAVLWAIYRIFRWGGNQTGRAWVGEGLGVGVAALLAVFMFKAADEFDYHTHLYSQHQHLSLVPVSKEELPISLETRLYPLAAIRSGMQSNHNIDVERVSNPTYVEAGGARWTATIEPMSPKKRLLDPIRELYNLPAATANVTFDVGSGQRVQDVCFDVYEQGLLGRNIEASAIRSLSLSQLPFYVPKDISGSARPMLNDDGEWVLVVPLDRYVGWPLRRKVFGGVVVMPQCESVPTAWLSDSWVNDIAPGLSAAVDSLIPRWLYRELFGIGTYVSPEEIAAGEHPYLKGNRLMAEVTMRRIAESFRYHRGWKAVAFRTVEGDIRVPDQKVDLNQMPHFGKWEGLPGRPEPAVYGNFILQPPGDAKTIAYELWIPGDGIMTGGDQVVYVLDAKAEGLEGQRGVSDVPGQVKDLLPQVDWDEFEVVEVTSYKREIGGTVRPLYLARLVTKGATGTVVFAGTPKVIVYDPVMYQAYELEHPEASPAAWDKEIRRAFGKKWGLPENGT